MLQRVGGWAHPCIHRGGPSASISDQSWSRLPILGGELGVAGDDASGVGSACQRVVQQRFSATTRLGSMPHEADRMTFGWRRRCGRRVRGLRNRRRPRNADPAPTSMPMTASGIIGIADHPVSDPTPGG